jgi:hypothetical protein
MIRRSLLLPLLLPLGVPLPARSAERAWIDVSVRVYDAAAVKPDDRTRALALAAALLAPAQLQIHFEQCDAKGAAPACATTPRPDELLLRLVRRPTPARRAAESLALGDALLDTRRRSGALATVYLERVEWLAREGRADASVMLGRAIAHELVHALSGEGRHAPRGLMRGVWSAREVAANRAEDWRLHDAETTSLRGRRSAASIQAALR